MNDIAGRRRASLQMLIDAHTLTGLSRIVGKPARQLNDIVKGRNSFGEKVARDIERAYAPDSNVGWLDHPEILVPRRQPGPVAAAPSEQPTWPFSTVPFADFQALDPEQKQRLEDRVAAFIDGALSARKTRSDTAA